MTLSDHAHDHCGARGPDRAWLDPSALTPAERLLMIQLAAGADIAAAARDLGVSRKSAANRLDTIRDKLGATTRSEAIEMWKRKSAARISSEERSR